MIAQGDAQLGMLLALKRQLSQASPANLAMVRAEIVACIASASNVSRQAETVAGSSAGPSASLAAASQAARSSVTSFLDDYYTKKKFDAYLHFSSDKDEEEFRQREAERKIEIEQALALHTPEGNLRAATLAQQQLKDAGAHGAAASPDFKPELAKLDGAVDHLLDAIKAPDSHKSAAAHTPQTELDPLDAIKPSLNVSRHEIAILLSAGVTLAEQGAGHGVSANVQRQEGVGRSPT